VVRCGLERGLNVAIFARFGNFRGWASICTASLLNHSFAAVGGRATKDWEVLKDGYLAIDKEAQIST